MTTTDPSKESKAPPALPWWATTDLVAAMIVATLQAVVIACARQNSESFKVVVGLAVVTLVTSIVTRMAPHIPIWKRRSYSKTLRYLSAVVRQIKGVLWSPFVTLLFGITLSVTEGPLLYRLIGIWLVLVGIGTISERKDAEVVWLFEDDFTHGLGAWGTVSGHPVIDANFGKPAPSLSLPFVDNRSTHSFACLKNVTDIANGEVECDLYLPKGSVAGIAFRSNISESSYYIAQLSARPDYPEGLFKRIRTSVSWQPIGTSFMFGTETGWHRIRASFSGSRLAFFKDGELSAYARDETLESGGVGIFNMQGQVYVDSFRVGSTTPGIRGLVRRLFGIEWSPLGNPELCSLCGPSRWTKR